MTPVSVMLVLLSFYIGINEKLQQVKTFVKVHEGARINSTPFSQVQNVEDADDCALACIENSACNSFTYTSANEGVCNLHNEDLDHLKIESADNSAVFTIKRKTMNLTKLS